MVPQRHEADPTVTWEPWTPEESKEAIAGRHEDTSYLVSASIILTLLLFTISFLTLSVTLIRFLKFRREKKRKEEALRRVRELRPGEGWVEGLVKREEGGKGRNVWERSEWEGVPA